MYNSGHQATEDSEDVLVGPDQPALPAHQVEVVGQGETLPGSLHQQARQGASMLAVNNWNDSHGTL